MITLMATLFASYTGWLVLANVVIFLICLVRAVVQIRFHNHDALYVYIILGLISLGMVLVFGRGI